MTAKKTKSKLLTLLMAFSMASLLHAGDGMWLPLLLQSLNEAEMQQMGMKLSAEDIYSVNQGSLKDAIVHFGGFCTSEIISDQGLLLTNHHCGYGQIQSHSSVDQNYLKDGFWAKAPSEELANPGLTATLISRMEDVTDAALAGVTDDMKEDDRQAIIDANLEGLRESIEREAHEDVVIRAFYYGNAYYAFVTVTYRDIRLVGAPPESIGKFGADTDNWVWPRHTGDFSLFRIYAGPDNLPADYSTGNVPYKPKHHLPISLDGVDPGDFTMIFGFPGRTQEYLPSQGISQVLEDVNPIRISLRDKALAIMDKSMRADPATKIMYASKFARIANGWKKWIGESQGLRDYGALPRKYELEKEFEQRIQQTESLSAYRGLLGQFEQLYTDINPSVSVVEFYNEIFYRNTEIFGLANRMMRLESTLEAKGKEAWKEAAMTEKSRLADFYKNYNPDIDREVTGALLMQMMEELDETYLPASLQQGMVEQEAMNAWLEMLWIDSHLDTEAEMEALLSMDDKAFTQALKDDPIVALMREARERLDETILPDYRILRSKISTAQRKYMAGLLEAFPERRFYPDANSTMRISYGKVDGYEPRDAITYQHQTYLEGVVEKYVPGDYEFDVDETLLSLYESKDYGDYADDGKMPVCFIGSNHTTGGNSGSPAIDAYGNLIGLNFDRTWEGTMSDLNYDPEICRNIMVDIRYVLFITDKYAGASHLIAEMDLVHPKADQSTDSGASPSSSKVPTLDADTDMADIKASAKAAAKEARRAAKEAKKAEKAAKRAAKKAIKIAKKAEKMG